MPFSQTNTLLEVISSADADGVIHFHVPKNEPMRNRADALEWLQVAFHEVRLPVLRLEVVKKAITEVDLAWQKTEDGTVITVNLAKLLLLPAVSPAQELAEFREMLESMKAFFEADPTQRRDIQLCNNRDHHRKVYGTATCRIPAPEKDKLQVDEAATAALKARIDASPVLTHWLRQVALTLQKIGPWSWTTIREQELFGYGQGPHFQHRERLRAITPPTKEEPRRFINLEID